MGDGKMSTVLANVKTARDYHNKTCRYKGVAIEVHFNPDDATRLGIEEGEDLCGLKAVHDHKVSPSRLRVYCDAELHGQGEPISAQSRSSITTPVKNPTPVKV